MLGIRLMRHELDLQQPVFKAEINTYSNSNNDAPSAAGAGVARTPAAGAQASRNKSSMCLVS